MNNLEHNSNKIAILWLIIAVCYTLHIVYHLSGLFYGIDIKMDDATGEVSPATHVFRIVTQLFTFTMAVLTLYIYTKTFYWVSLIWAALLGILNLIHVGQEIATEYQDYSQVALLLFISIVNTLLLWKLWFMKPDKYPSEN